MKRAITVFVLALIGADIASRADTVAADRVFTKVLRGTEVSIPAPKGTVEACDRNVRIWKYFQSVAIGEDQHLLACFIPPDWLQKKDDTDSSGAGMSNEPMFFVTISLPTLDQDFDEKAFVVFEDGFLDNVQKVSANRDVMKERSRAIDKSFGAYSSTTHRSLQSEGRPPTLTYLPGVERTTASVSVTALKTAYYVLDGVHKVDASVESLAIVHVGPRIVILRSSAFRPPAADAQAAESKEVQSARRSMSIWVQQVLAENSK